MTTTTETRTLDVPGATLAYDVHGPLPTADGRPPVLVVGQPMEGPYFHKLASLLTGRTAVTYDPRGLGRSTRHDGGTTNDPVVQAEDLHALVGALGAGPVDLFGSSGGAITGLALVTAHPEDVRTLVAHEPPLLTVLPDAEAAAAAGRRVDEAYQRHGWGTGMATFIALASWKGEITDDVVREPVDPAQFGFPSDDDGRRDDALLSGVSAPVTAYRPDVDALAAAPTRIVLAVGEESRDLLTWRAPEALAARLGLELTVFPGDHGGFLDPANGYGGVPEAFAARLLEVLADGA
ncbi:alpha/beta fold hydrolase [Cellulomonas fimi]|uniref:Alpha/beta hydrolase fold protein n=1 Tax=Cellulomonas fimi (strain ATCC 484 / DSM 20113 / JCM 1341 / CCUG 24087 / LMG 16345 / NBRC 15513 / NCIMB 8980 / NCTC 7547 / NRS-133) TaxID=590998 RepID=F4H564_CELFA|nr:alpha/beta hydrolase [Cellulomonas fimi]AEE46670.1 alpha/beta hydrolase fold protein [Cellulomonas fimi ATCC 484]NNH07685.1 alpha/beta hydrolase [Cellulomonas fimi]VEH33834.1 Uncharacterized hydrolase SAV2581 [Cellulomonas fimi]